jgi:hypothetical protein
MLAVISILRQVAGLRSPLPVVVASNQRHLFLSCSMFGSLWALVRSWIAFSAIDSHHLSDHFYQFTYSSGRHRGRRTVLSATHMALMCLGCVKREKSETLRKLNTIPSSNAGQGQTIFLLVVEDK